MSIRYATITVGAEPAAPMVGDLWLTPVDSSSYAGYIWLDEWVTFVGGGTYAAETDADTHYITAVIQEDAPDNIIQMGWLWIKYSIKTAYIYLGDYVAIASV